MDFNGEVWDHCQAECRRLHLPRLYDSLHQGETLMISEHFQSLFYGLAEKATSSTSPLDMELCTIVSQKHLDRLQSNTC